MQFTPEDQFILSNISIVKSDDELQHMDNLILQIHNWDYLTNTIISRGIAPILYKKLTFFRNNQIIPLDTKVKLKSAYYKTLSRNTVLFENFRIVSKALKSNNIDVIALKGIYLSEWLYKDIGLRQLSDIDLLVKVEDGIKCLNILKDIGYEPTSSFESVNVRSKKEIVHYEPMVKDGISVEIHIKLHKSVESYNIDNVTIWKNAVQTAIHGFPAFTLGKYDLLIHICVHLDKHFKGGHVQFTCFMDIVNLLEKYAEEPNWKWDELIVSCKTYNCTKEVFKYIIMCHRYMNAKVPHDIATQFEYLLEEKSIDLFKYYIKGVKSNHHGSLVKSHFFNISKIDRTRDKLKYIFGATFPNKYYIKNTYMNNMSMSEFEKSPMRFFWWVWYPYRWYVGLKGVVKLIIKNKDKKINQRF